MKISRIRRAARAKLVCGRPALCLIVLAAIIYIFLYPHPSISSGVLRYCPGCKAQPKLPLAASSPLNAHKTLTHNQTTTTETTTTTNTNITNNQQPCSAPTGKENPAKENRPCRYQDWPQFFKPRTKPQFSMDFPYQLEAARACRGGKGASPDMLLMTLSRPGNFVQRKVIRETWGSVVRSQAWPSVNGTSVPLAKTMAQVFLMGQDVSLSPNDSEALRKESDQFGDLVQWAGLNDSYFNLTLKVLLGLRWATQFCPNISHVIKTDDDTFVHVPRLLNRLQSTTGDLIWGGHSSYSQCLRGGKYAVAREAYPFDYYPPHAKGMLYVLPMPGVVRMDQVAAYFPYNNMEDTHVTGTLAHALGLGHKAFSSREFSLKPEVPSPCLFQKVSQALGSQMVPVDLHRTFWNGIQTGSC